MKQSIQQQQEQLIRPLMPYAKMQRPVTPFHIANALTTESMAPTNGIAYSFSFKHSFVPSRLIASSSLAETQS